MSDGIEDKMSQFAEDRKRLQDMQGRVGTPSDENSGVDMYAEFRDEDDVNYDRQHDEDNEDIVIERTPDPDHYKQYQDKDINQFDNELFPGGPLVSDVDSWKKQYEHNGHRIVIAEIGDEVYIFRTLNRFEYKQIVALPNSNPVIREEIFCKTCVLWPIVSYQSMTEGKGGVPSTLAQIIMEHSGFVREWETRIL